MTLFPICRNPDLISVRFIAGDIASKRDAFLQMFRLVVGNSLAAGSPITDIARTLGMPAARLIDWIGGAIRPTEVDEMSGACIAFAHARGLALESVAQ
jgi:hypothetical protein